MPNKVYDKNGFKFEYPDDWTIESYDDGVSVTSPTEITWTIRRFPAHTNGQEFLQEVAEALKEEYKSIEVGKTLEEINPGVILETWEIDFYCLDFPCVAQAQTLKTPFAIYVLYYQTYSDDLDDVAPIIDDMLNSWLEPFRQLDANAGLIDNEEVEEEQEE